MPHAEGLARKFEVLARVLDERTRRLVAAAEAEAIGFGGVTAVAQASGLSRGNRDPWNGGDQDRTEAGARPAHPAKRGWEKTNR